MSTPHDNDDPLMQVGIYYYLGGPRYWEEGPPIPLVAGCRHLDPWEEPDLSRPDYPGIAFDDLGLSLLLAGRHIFVIWQPPRLVLPPFPPARPATPPLVLPPAAKPQRRP